MNSNAKKPGCVAGIKERLGIEVTTMCNMDCVHCFARADNPDPCSLPLDLAKKIIAEGHHVGYRHLHVTGGEPLLWDGLAELLDAAFDMGYETVFLNSNGTVLTNDLSRRLAAYEGFSMSVSLDGTEALHEHLRGKGAYKLAIQGIEAALNWNIDLCVFTTACRSLLPVLLHFADDLYGSFPGIEHLTLIQLIPLLPGEGSGLSEELLEPEDFLQLVEMVSLLNLLGRKTRFLNNPLAHVASKHRGIFWVPRSAPAYFAGSMIVMANRDICLYHSSRDSFGKYEMGMIERVLASDEYRGAVAPDGVTCPSCGYSRLCLESGMVRPSEYQWDILSGVPYCQRVLNAV